MAERNLVELERAADSTAPAAISAAPPRAAELTVVVPTFNERPMCPA
jgi:hypothetical protein